MTLMWVWGRIPVFQEAYAEQTKKIEDNAWLRVQCKDPRMHLHTDACHNIETIQQPTAFWAGLCAAACISCSISSTNTDGYSGGGFREGEAIQPHTWAILAIGFILLIPNVFLPMYKAYEDKQEHIRVVKACSPMLFPSSSSSSSSSGYYYKNTDY
jgi:hypothetical protein